MAENKLIFIAKIEDVGAIDKERRQTIRLKDVILMNGFFFTEQDGFVRITIEEGKGKK